MPRRQDEDVGTPSLLSIAMASRTSAIYAAQKLLNTSWLRTSIVTFGHRIEFAAYAGTRLPGRWCDS